MDAIAEWAAAQQRVVALIEDVTATDAGAVERAVPACPDWTVRDLLAHMVGLDADVLAGDEPDDHNPSWTQRQVDARADRDVAALLDEWRALAGPLQEWMRTSGTRPLGDVVIHEQDIRGALNRPGGRGTAAQAALADRLAAVCADRVAARELEPLRLEGPGWAFGPPGADVVVRAADFELARLVMSRRSAEQMRAWTVSGDVEPYLDCFGGLGPLPTTSLVE